jgi:hypothetical protein
MTLVDGFSVHSVDGQQLIREDKYSFEGRNDHTFALISDAFDRLKIPFQTIHVNTGDKPCAKEWQGRPVLSYSTTDNDLSHCCPDFVFNHWHVISELPYDKACKKFLQIKGKPKTNQCGWRGVFTCPEREIFAAKAKNNSDFDVEEVSWDKSCTPYRPVNGVTMEEAFKRWRYLIDIEGAGYSGRLKMLLAGSRLVFIVDRPYQEFFMPMLIPYVHYIPVKRDLSDLEEQMAFIRARPELEERIIGCMNAFWRAHLSREAAVRRWQDLLLLHGGPY